MDPERLQNEWLGYRDLSGPERGSLGVSWTAAQLAGGVAKAKVKVIGMVWEPDEAGVPHVIVPVFVPAAPSIFNAVTNPTLIDMVAFSPAEPGQWFWRTRQAFALGLDRLDTARAMAAPIILHPDPLEWLRANCEGAVLLDFPMARAA